MTSSISAARPTAASIYERPYSIDLIALLAGLPLADARPRPASESRALVDGLLTAWQILPSLSEARLAEVAAIVAPEDALRLRRAWLAVTAFARVQTAATATFLDALEASRLNYALLKGSATARLLYPEPHMRTGWDLDVGVHRADLRRIEALAHDCGFVAAQQDLASGEFNRADPLLKAKVEAEHYELGFLVRRFEVTNLGEETLEALRTEPSARRFWFDVDAPAPRCYASLDVHHALSHDIAIDALLDAAQRVSLPTGDIRIPDTAWLLVHLIFKIYWEGVHNYGKGLYQYADLVRLMPRVDAEIFARVSEILDQHRLTAAGYYVLRRMPLFGIALPSHVLSFIDENNAPGGEADAIFLNDLGDMWPKIWGTR